MLSQTTISSKGQYILKHLQIRLQRRLIYNRMQNYKKQGLEESESEFLCQEKKIFLRGIPRKYVVKSKIQIDHLTCCICNQIIWKAVACSQQNCFANFCEYCVGNYDQGNLMKELQEDSFSDIKSETIKKCPKCDKIFQKTSIPLINSLLSQIKLKCLYFSYGCNQIISYDCYLKHTLQCTYRKIQCEGCNQPFLQKELQEHKRQCEYIVVECEKCGMKLTQSEFRREHTSSTCLQTLLKNKTAHIKQLEIQMENLRSRLCSYQTIIEKIIKGETIPLHIQFYSSFPFNFHFANHQAKLIKASWNQVKEKFDFLHFYLTSSIKTESPVGFQWRINVNILKGNLLIGICSSLSTNSVDFVINRFGEIKKKQSNENKYKLIRKSNFSFSQGDNISFKYLALRKILKIENQTKKLESRLEGKEIIEIGENLYSFYSLDTINDSIKFF